MVEEDLSLIDWIKLGAVIDMAITKMAITKRIVDG
jgi:hypothetical protein